MRPPGRVLPCPVQAIEVSMAFFIGGHTMKKYIKSISALNELTLSLKDPSEAERYAESDLFWAASKRKSIPDRTVKKGEVYQFEFGKNLPPEMSYEHRGLVIGLSGKLLYVLPIYSYNSKIPGHQNAIHPTDNPNGRSNFFLLKESEFEFLTHDSVLKLNDLRSLSFSRIKYRQNSGLIPPSSDTYRLIEYHAFSRHFPTYSYEYNQLKEQNKQLRASLAEAEATKLSLQAQLEHMNRQ